MKNWKDVSLCSAAILALCLLPAVADQGRSSGPGMPTEEGCRTMLFLNDTQLTVCNFTDDPSEPTQLRWTELKYDLENECVIYSYIEIEDEDEESQYIRNDFTNCGSETTTTSEGWEAAQSAMASELQYTGASGCHDQTGYFLDCLRCILWKYDQGLYGAVGITLERWDCATEFSEYNAVGDYTSGGDCGWCYVLLEDSSCTNCNLITSNEVDEEQRAIGDGLPLVDTASP